jgi:hypothetical protein
MRVHFCGSLEGAAPSLLRNWQAATVPMAKTRHAQTCPVAEVRRGMEEGMRGRNASKDHLAVASTHLDLSLRLPTTEDVGAGEPQTPG